MGRSGRAPHGPRGRTLPSSNLGNWRLRPSCRPLVAPGPITALAAVPPRDQAHGWKRCTYPSSHGAQARCSPSGFHTAIRSPIPSPKRHGMTAAVPALAGDMPRPPPDARSGTAPGLAPAQHSRAGSRMVSAEHCETASRVYAGDQAPRVKARGTSGGSTGSTLVPVAGLGGTKTLRANTGLIPPRGLGGTTTVFLGFVPPASQRAAHDPLTSPPPLCTPHRRHDVP